MSCCITRAWGCASGRWANIRPRLYRLGGHLLRPLDARGRAADGAALRPGRVGRHPLPRHGRTNAAHPDGALRGRRPVAGPGGAELETRRGVKRSAECRRPCATWTPSLCFSRGLRPPSQPAGESTWSDEARLWGFRTWVSAVRLDSGTLLAVARWPPPSPLVPAATERPPTPPHWLRRPPSSHQTGLHFPWCLSEQTVSPTNVAGAIGPNGALAVALGMPALQAPDSADDNGRGWPGRAQAGSGKRCAGAPDCRNG